MKVRYLAMLSLLLISACKRQQPSNAEQPGSPKQTLAEARKDFRTHLVSQVRAGVPIDMPPANFDLVRYASPAGQLGAYQTIVPLDGKLHPAIIWITGGDCNTIGDVWSVAPANNDQTAAAYRRAGIVMMFPSLRGGNDNAGQQEGMYGEVDDVLAAADYLSRQNGIDPARIYLGGHSTGGTLVLLVSEYTDRFRAVFSFGPVDSPNRYDVRTFQKPWDPNDPRELELRSPGKWLHSITQPTFVFEGGKTPSNAASLNLMAGNKNVSSQAHFFIANNYTHFSILAPMNKLVASKIVADTGEACNISFTQDEVNAVR